MRRYRLIISILVLLIPVVFALGVMSGQSDVLDHPDAYRLKVMHNIERDLDIACGYDAYCRQAFVDC